MRLVPSVWYLTQQQGMQINHPCLRKGRSVLGRERTNLDLLRHTRVGPEHFGTWHAIPFNELFIILKDLYLFIKNIPIDKRVSLQ